MSETTARISGFRLNVTMTDGRRFEMRFHVYDKASPAEVDETQRIVDAMAAGVRDAGFGVEVIVEQTAEERR